MQISTSDRIGRVRADWASQRPDLDTSPMEVIGRILRAEHLAGARIRRVLRAEGLDRGGFDVLATLRRSGPPYRLTPTRLYQELVLTSGAITHRVDALARAGLVERVSGGPDRRSPLVGRTGPPAGRLSAHPVDIGDPAQVTRLFDRVGTLSHLVVTAADLPYGPVVSLSEDSMVRAVRSKILGPLFAAQQAAPRITKPGSI